jgi:hypothetical protein
MHSPSLETMQNLAGERTTRLLHRKFYLVAQFSDITDRSQFWRRIFQYPRPTHSRPLDSPIPPPLCRHHPSLVQTTSPHRQPNYLRRRTLGDQSLNPTRFPYIQPHSSIRPLHQARRPSCLHGRIRPISRPRCRLLCSNCWSKRCS